MTFTTIFDKVLANNSDTWSGATLVQLIPASLVGSAASKIRFTLNGSTLSPTGILAAYVGHRGAGDIYDFAAAPVQITVGGNGAFTLPQSGSVVSDDITFAYNGTSDLLVAFAITTNTSQDDIRTLFGSSVGTSYFFKYGGNDASTVNKSGYSGAGSNPNALAIISKIEIEAVAPPPPPTYDPVTITRYEHFRAAWPIELVSEVRPVLNYTNYIDRSHMWRRFAHVLVTDVQAGDILDVSCALEATNPNSYPIEWVYGLVITPSASGTAGCENMPSVSSTYEPSGGKLISRMGGQNVTGHAYQHHAIFPLSVKYTVPTGISGDQYVAAIGYAAGSSLSGTNDALVIEPYCGDLSVTLVRKA